ncbi:MAG: PaaI family thioesterase [Sphingomonadaceae bacterium]
MDSSSHSPRHHTDGPPPEQQWEPIPDSGEFILANGPFYQTRNNLVPGEPIRFGFRVTRQHCNGMGVCHGGMLATFIDTAMARGLLATGGLSANIPTISMTLDYLAPAALGDWIESRITILRRARTLGFVRATLQNGGGQIMRGNAVFRQRPLEDKGAD